MTSALAPLVAYGAHGSVVGTVAVSSLPSSPVAAVLAGSSGATLAVLWPLSMVCAFGMGIVVVLGVAGRG